MRLSMTNKELIELVEKVTGLKIDTLVIDRNSEVLNSVYIKKDDVSISDYWEKEIAEKYKEHMCKK